MFISNIIPYRASMKSFVIVFFLLLPYAYPYAQTKGFDRALANPPENTDSAAINSLISTSVGIYLQYPDSARAIAEKGLLLSKQINYENGIGASFAAIGYTYWAQSYYAFSLYFLFNAEDYLKAGKRYGDLSMMYRIIARNYAEMEKYTEAQEYLKKSEANAMLSHDNGKIGLVYNEKSLIDYRQKNYDQAWKKANTALTLAYQYKDTLLAGIIYSRLGDIAKQTGHAELTKPYYDSAYRWSLLSNNNRLRSMLLTDYANFYLQADKADTALMMANAASALADSTGNITVKVTAAGIIAKCFHAKKDIGLELSYQAKYSQLQDSISNEFRKKGFLLFSQFFSLNSKLHELEIKEHANIVNKERIRFQHIIIIVLGMFVIILLAGLITIYFLYKEKKLLNDQLADSNSAITNQKNIIEEQSQHLAQLNDLKTKLFAVISHDLRAPISSLRSIMGLFQNEGLNEEQAIALLKRMLPALDAADLTLSNLLNWSVKQMSGLRVNQSTVTLYPLVEEIARIFDFALQQKNIAFANIVPDGLKIYFDEHHLTIILRNLVSNAIKFTPKDGRITIGVISEEKFVKICVRDTGLGMAPADMDKLFKGATYFSTRGTGGEKGTGLGLMLCKELLELNGAAISVESEQGKGSTFYVTVTTLVNS